MLQGTCYAPAIVPLCSGNGEVQLLFGSAAYVGLGALVFAMLVFIELFGCASYICCSDAWSRSLHCSGTVVTWARYNG
jgi:hypothetical protein